MTVQIIAEAGVTHGGSLKAAAKLADIALQAGATAVKFQTFDPTALLRENDPSMPLLASLALPRKDFVALALYCDHIGIEFLSTPGDVDSLHFLVEECGVRRIKIGSDDLTFEPLVQSAYKTGLPVILSTGMATLDEVRKALPKTPVQDLTILHCVSQYPCPVTEINLKAMDTLAETFGWPVGYSDHTDHMAACFAAVAKGATIIEKHFCPDGYKGPDDCVSINPDGLHELVVGVRTIEAMLGNGIKAPTKEELKSIPILRKDKQGFRGLLN
jgi:N,N'-diacetyllegionaminate synthase